MPFRINLKRVLGCWDIGVLGYLDLGGLGRVTFKNDSHHKGY